LGDLWFRTGDIESAATSFEESLRLTQELGDHYLMAWSLGGLADVARLRADYKRATEMFEEALSLYQSSGDKIGPPYTLEALGLVAAALGDAKRAARLWGAASAWREAINEPLPPTYQRDYAASITQARTQLGEEVYASAWSEGHAMSPEQAIALALEE
jgi:tetratricopeptide (TPR) repeat protein